MFCLSFTCLFIKQSEINKINKIASIIDTFTNGVKFIAKELTVVAGSRPALTTGFKEGLSSMKFATGGLTL